VSPCDRNSGGADQKRNGEEHSAGPGEPKPVAEPFPIASESRHTGSLGQRTSVTLPPWLALDAPIHRRSSPGPSLEAPADAVGAFRRRQRALRGRAVGNVPRWGRFARPLVVSACAC
jgi:hypothetical protein